MTSKPNEENIMGLSLTSNSNTSNITTTAAFTTFLQVDKLVDKSDFQVANNKDYDEKEIVQNDADDDFILVKSKRRTKHKGRDMLMKMTSTILNNQQNNVREYNDNHEQTPEEKQINFEEVLDLKKKVDLCKANLLLHDDLNYWSKSRISISSLFESINQNNKHIQLVCYGLGSVDNSIASRYQFAFLLLIIDLLREMQFDLDTIEFYDPAFTHVDKGLLREVFKFRLIDQNELCMRNVQHVASLFFMPHCDKEFYNNLLYSNWSLKSLSNLYIIGNSFRTIQLNTLEEIMSTRLSFIKDSLLFLDEIRLDHKCSLSNDAFYDLCFLRFNSSNQSEQQQFRFLNELSLDFDVTKLKKPIYLN